MGVKPKRKSTDGARPSPNKAAKTNEELRVPVDALLKEHVKTFDAWLCLGSA